MVRVIVVAVFVGTFFTSSLPVSAADLGLSIQNMSPGSSSCGAWREARESAGKGNTILVTHDGMSLVEKLGWVGGYMTAMNEFVLPTDRGAIRNLMDSTDTQGVYSWIDNYCAAHPLDDLFEATVHLTSELETKWLANHPKVLKRR